MHFAVNGVHFFVQRAGVVALRFQYGVDVLNVLIGVVNKVIEQGTVGVQNIAQHFQLHVVLLALLLHFFFQQYGVGYICHVHQHAGNVFAVIYAVEIEIQIAFFIINFHFLAHQWVQRGNQTFFGAGVVELPHEVVGGVQVVCVNQVA